MSSATTIVVVTQPVFLILAWFIAERKGRSKGLFLGLVFGFSVVGLVACILIPSKPRSPHAVGHRPSVTPPPDDDDDDEEEGEEGWDQLAPDPMRPRQDKS